LKNNIHNKIKECYSTWSKSYYNDYYKSTKNYPAIHIDIVKSLLKKNKIKNVLDIGCGPASMLREISNRKLSCFGFDFTEEMIIEGKRILKKLNLDENNVWVGSATKKKDYYVKKKKYDSVISFGVFPHLNNQEENKVIKNSYEILKKNGIILIEARNSLFSLFTQNRYTSEFLRNNLIKIEPSIKEENDNLKKIFNRIEDKLFMNQPFIRKGKKGMPGYDQVLSKTNNPFLMEEKFRRIGFKNIQTYFYHYHIVPPVYQKFLPKTFIKRSLKIENPLDWRGYFMASAFITFGKK